MKISSVKTWPIKIPDDTPYLGDTNISGEYYQRPPYNCLYSKKYESIFVCIETDEGLKGWGEALAPVGPEIVSEIIDSLLKVILVGENPFNTEILWNKMFNSMRVRGHQTGFMMDAIAACDIALWDIKGKTLNVPLWKLLGGQFRSTVPAYVSGLPKESLNEKLKLAEKWKDKGFNSFKVHAGNGIEEDVKLIRSLRDKLGPSAKLMIDTHWNYSLNQAKELANKLKMYDVLFIEAPLIPEDYQGHYELRTSVNTDIAIGEGERNKFQFKEILSNKCSDVLQPDIGRVGITEFLKIAHIAEAYNKKIAPHLSTHLGISTAAAIHLSAVISNFLLLEYQPLPFRIGNKILKNKLECNQGQYIIPKKPGIGTEPDIDKLKEFKVC